MKINTILLSANLVIVIVLSVYLFSTADSPKRAFILNQRVFEAYKGTQQLQARLTELREDHKHQLDSMALLIRDPNNREQIDAYEEQRHRYALAEQALSDQYTVDIWKQINKHISNFGEEQGYDFIFGATGDGNLMFAHDAYNLTDHIIAYINQKYEGN